MTTVTFVGVKGAGKTTAAMRLAESSPRIRYLYMGLNIESANAVLPTTRLIRALKRRAGKAGANDSSAAPVPHAMANLVDRRGGPLAIARMINRLAEQLYRHALSGVYQLRGYTVVYDRHAFFETAHGAQPEARLTDRVLRPLTRALFSKPRFVIFLDAAPDALVARSGGVDADVLRRKREQLVAQLPQIEEVITIDASQPPERVLERVRHALQLPDEAAAKASRHAETSRT